MGDAAPDDAAPAPDDAAPHADGEADDATRRVRELEAEMQLVKQRAVKKIRALEEKAKATAATLEAERAAHASAREEWDTKERTLIDEVAQLQAESAQSQPLQSQIALMMQQELSLSHSLRKL